MQTNQEFPNATGLTVPRIKLVQDEETIGKTVVEIIKDLRGIQGQLHDTITKSWIIILLDKMPLKGGEERIISERLKPLIMS